MKSCCSEAMVLCRKLKKPLPTAHICVINVYTTTVGMLGNVTSLLNDILNGLSVCFKIQLIYNVHKMHNRDINMSSYLIVSFSPPYIKDI